MYPKLILTCEEAGIYVHGAGKNPMAEVRRLDTGERIGHGPLQLMSIVAHIDLNEWAEVEDESASTQARATFGPTLSDDDRRLVQRQVLELLIAQHDEFLARYDGDTSAQVVLRFILDGERWASLGLSDRLDQGLRHLNREQQLELLEPLTEKIAGLRSRAEPNRH